MSNIQELAKRLVLYWQERELILEFEVASLKTQLERILQQHSQEIRSTKILIDGSEFELETAAGCFLGETFSRLFNGVWEWSAPLDPIAGVNFYRAKVRFGHYLFNPFCWLAFKLNHGMDEGTVTDLVEAVCPSMRDGVDYHERDIEEQSKHGTVIDPNVF